MALLPGQASGLYLRTIISQIFLNKETQHADYQEFTFPNGLRMVHRQVSNTRIAHCGFVLDTGSRDEKPGQEGIAHFWEHMAFKGTNRRKSFHILNGLEILGGEINAYTTKEKIAFHASVLATHFSKAVDILSDITFNSIFPEKEIEKEKNVILEEMSMYLDTPDDAIQDEFDALMFPGHPLGNNILGTETSVPSITREDFLKFYRDNVSSDRLVFSCVVPFDLKTAIKRAGPFLSAMPTLKVEKIRLAPEPLKAQEMVCRKPIQQAHLMMGCRAYPMGNQNRLPFFLLNNILGGPALTSRLNMSIRERYGLVYSVESGYSAFLDTGVFSVYLGTEPKNLSKAIDLVEKEIRHLINEPLSPTRLRQAREQLKAQLAMAEEGNQMFMLMLGKSMLDQGRVESLVEIFTAIDQIDAGLLKEIARESWDHDNWVRLSYVPEGK